MFRVSADCTVVTKWTKGPKDASLPIPTKLTNKSFSRNYMMKTMNPQKQVGSAPGLGTCTGFVVKQQALPSQPNCYLCAEILEYAKWLGMDTENEKVCDPYAATILAQLHSVQRWN